MKRMRYRMHVKRMKENEYEYNSRKKEYVQTEVKEQGANEVGWEATGQNKRKKMKKRSQKPKSESNK